MEAHRRFAAFRCSLKRICETYPPLGAIAVLSQMQYIRTAGTDVRKIKEHKNMSAVDYFLKIDGIKGESQDSKHGGEIEIQSFSWGATQSGSFAQGGGGGAGKVTMQDFHFTVFHGVASPKLMLACATGQHIPSAVLTARKAGKDQQDYMKVSFYDLLISSFQTGGSAAALTLPIRFRSTSAKSSTSTRSRQKEELLAAPSRPCST